MDYNQEIKKTGLKKLKIAEEMGISYSMLSAFLNGRRNLSPENLRKLHKVLGI